MALVKNAKNNLNLFCHDCKKQIKVENKNIQDGIILVYNDEGEKIKILKCNDCFKKNPSLTNFKKCEVYSRIVGYLRPVSQWNVGKIQEYEQRREYKLSKN
ncbi:MAG: anaerobic ribonucleoside-triphosphate reductase [Patescibacteria group bacterium]|nr:anaerobic ribonucleoside-triphosphate reductase [Patescibacteria group bacterium]